MIGGIRLNNKNSTLKLVGAITVGLTLVIPILNSLADVVCSGAELVKGKINKHIVKENIEIEKLQNEESTEMTHHCGFENGDVVTYPPPEELENYEDYDDDEDDKLNNERSANNCIK